MARRMMTERMLEIAPIVVAIVSGAFIAAVMPNSWLSIAVVIVTFVLVLYLAMRRR